MFSSLCGVCRDKAVFRARPTQRHLLKKSRFYRLTITVNIGMSDMERMDNPLRGSSRLPFSRRLLPNRVVKVAMAECLAVFGGGPPTEGHQKIYASWARGGWGMIISGNVQIDPDWLSTPWDLAVPRSLDPTPASLAPWISFVDAVSRAASSSDDLERSSTGPLVIQLSHPGRQSPLFARRRMFSSPLAPSPIPISSQGLINSISNSLLFRTPRENVSDEEIDDVLQRFGQTAGFLEKAGVEGVQIHAAHGYLLAQLLSPLSNKRPSSSAFSLQPDPAVNIGDVDRTSDSDSKVNDLEALRRVLRYVRENTKREFIVGIKMNCGDFVDGGLSEDEAIKQVIHVRQMLVQIRRHGEEMSEEGWDFVELSGGNYTNPVFASSSGPNISFQSFSARLLKMQPSPSLPPLLLSSSLRAIPSLLSSVPPSPSLSAHLLGFARPSIAHPALPRSHLLQRRDEVREFEMPNLDHVYQWSDLFTLSFLLGRSRRRYESVHADSRPDGRTSEVQAKAKPKSSSGLIGAGLGTIWWTFQINRLVHDRPFKPDLGIWEGAFFQFGPGIVSACLAWSWWALIGLVAFLAWAATATGLKR